MHRPLAVFCCFKAEEAKVKILEVAGDRVDNKSKLEVIRQEEEIIRREKEERKKEEEAEKLAKAKVLAEGAAEAVVFASHNVTWPSQFFWHFWLVSFHFIFIYYV